MAHNQARKDDAYDDEIIALLHQVGQRLIQSEQDRKILKRAMDDLAEKADQGERAYLTIQDRLNKTESAIEKRQRAMEKSQNEQMARIEKAAAMADRLEEAMAQYDRINRRLDKVAQDKARMIRKLERIEEAVIETHDVLNGKALAMLGARSETGRTKDSDEDDPLGRWLPPVPAANDGNAENAGEAWWQKPAAVRAGIVAAMLVVGVSGGLAIAVLRQGLDTGSAAPATADIAAIRAPSADAAAATARASAPSFDDLEPYSAPGRTDAERERFTAALEEALTEPAAGEESTISEQAAAEDITAAAPGKDPIDMTDDELLASLNNDPDALAAKLNEMDIGAGQAMPENIEQAAPVPAAPAVEKAALPPPRKEIKEISTADFLKAQTQAQPVAARLSPDAALPPVIREVEAKAFEGVAEAQHDLAAIYTAGHGGVKVDYAKAAAWFRESGVKGIANAQYNLGVLYHQGLGVTQDINTAVGWYRAAAEQGHPEAQYNLGIAYIEGVGTRYDPEKAAYYFEQAAGKGVLEAAYNLGLIHENGLTGSARPDEALYWYKTAADLGSPEAKAAMDQLTKTLGLMPAEVDRMYNKIREEEKKAQSQPATPAAIPERKAASAPQQPPAPRAPTATAGGGVEYLEAQPLDDTSAAPAASAAQAPAPRPQSALPATKSDNPAVTAQIQEQLIRLGLYPGPADGVNDTLTTDAIRAYQNKAGIKTDGRPSEALLVHMMTSDLGDSEEYGSRQE